MSYVESGQKCQNLWYCKTYRLLSRKVNGECAFLSRINESWTKSESFLGRLSRWSLMYQLRAHYFLEDAVVFLMFCFISIFSLVVRDNLAQPKQIVGKSNIKWNKKSWDLGGNFKWFHVTTKNFLNNRNLTGRKIIRLDMGIHMNWVNNSS